MKNERVLITGASSGIGWELAKLFARDGYDLIVVARNAEKLNQLKRELETAHGVNVAVVVKDLTRQDHVTALYEELRENGLRVDMLVNNAGYGLYGKFIETDLQDELNMIELNVATLTHLTKLFLPDMVKRNKGRIMNVASTAAFQPGPLMAVYYATKAYVLSFTEALENELKGTNVTVTALCPGATATGFESRANLQQSKLFKRGVMDVQTVARIGYDAFLNGKTIVIPGWKNRLLANSVRFLPRKLVTSVVRMIQEKA
jgi:short-subunit dehydrogenase